MTTTDIIVELENLTNQKLDQRSVTRELDDLGFIRRSTRHGMYKEKVTSMWVVKKTGRETFEPYKGPNPF